MEKIRNLSLKRTLVLYMVLALTAGFLLSAVIGYGAERLQKWIWYQYIDEEEYYKAIELGREMAVLRPAQSEMRRADLWLSELCDFLQTYGVLCCAIAGSVLAVGMFYRNKLSRPISELRRASRRIGENDLDFRMEYGNRDEMGQLCLQFERMRSQLAENNRRMWRMVEEEKALRAAIAHDIRSPLTILRGYQEMLLEFVPEGAMSGPEIMEMLREGMGQIERMNRFIETMRKLSSFEERKLLYRETSLETLAESIRKNAGLMGQDMGKVCTVAVRPRGGPGQPAGQDLGERDGTDSRSGARRLLLDEELILEVVENLLSNALRYAKTEVWVRLAQAGDALEIVVADDGAGFVADAEEVTKPFYHTNPQDDLKHFGLGMYICRVYCERHGGRLLVENRPQGGGAVKAVFHSGTEEEK